MLKILSPDSIMKDDMLSDGSKFKAAQKSIVLPAGTATHIDIDIRYIDMGEAQQGTVLLMHGIPTWGFLYHQVIPKFVSAGYRVIAPDFLGHGWSDRRDRFDRSFQDTGGAVALIMAIESPNYVNRLVICNSVCYDRFDDGMLDFGHPLRWNHRPLEELIKTLEECLSDGLSNTEQLTPEFIQGIIAPWASEEGKLSLLRNASALNPNQTMALVDRHSSISAPTLIIWGVNDPWQKTEDGQRLASEIPSATFHSIKSASHWVPQDTPEEFTHTVLDFLSKSLPKL
jgi:haloalkane dehalogenase